jgi:NAD(P)-dependent dehydrogenase (short-subunit alcohol dehydrogenase family)
VRDADAVTRAVEEFADATGRLDVLVNNAGTGDLRPLHTVDDKLWHRLIDVNLTGTYHGMRAAVPLMLEAGGGSIVNNASLSGFMPTRNEAAYSAAKAGVIALTKSGALEYGPTVRVNCVAPGHVRTPLTSVWDQFPEACELRHRADRCR